MTDLLTFLKGCKPIASPGPCAICGEPANGWTAMLSSTGKHWELCGSSDCWSAAGREVDEEEKRKPPGVRR